MPRNNRRNAKIRAIRKRQQALAKSVKKQAKDAKTQHSNDENGDVKSWSLNDDQPSTSKQAAKYLECAAAANAVDEETTAPTGFWKKPVKQQEKTSVSLKRKQRKSVKRSLINVDFRLSPLDTDVEDDDNEMSNLLPPMRYVDVARAAMQCHPAQAPKVQQQRELNMGLEEFPLLQPRKIQHFETYEESSADGFDLSSSILESESDTDETATTSDTTENYNLESVEQEFAKLEMSPKASNSGALSSKNPCVKSTTSGIYCESDSASTTGSYWTEASNEHESEMETINYDADEGAGGDATAAAYAADHANNSAPPDECTSSFSPEWLEATVKYLSTSLGISIPSFNFLEADLDFPRSECQFDDTHYMRLEQRAINALQQQTQHKNV